MGVIERYHQKENRGRSAVEERYISKIGLPMLIEKIGAVQNKAINLSNQYNARYFDANGVALPTQWRADSNDWMMNVQKEREQIANEVMSLSSQLDSFRKYIDEDTFTKAKDALGEAQGNANTILSHASSENRVFSQFESADVYNSAVKQSELKTKWDGMQTDGLRQEWEGLPEADRDLMVSYLSNYRAEEVPDIIPSEYWKNYRNKLRTATTSEDTLMLRLLQRDYAASEAAGYVGNNDYLKAKEQEIKDKYGVDQLDQSNPNIYTTEDGYGMNLNNLIVHAENREMMRTVRQSPQLSQAYDRLSEYSRDAELMKEIASEFDENMNRGMSAEEALAKRAQDVEYLSKAYGILLEPSEYTSAVLNAWASKIKSGRYEGQSQHIQALAQAGIDWQVLDNYNDSMATVEAQKEQKKAVHDFAVKYPWAAAPLAVAAAPLTIAEYAGNVAGNFGNTLVAPMFNGGRVMPSTSLGINAYDDKVGNFIDAANEGVAQAIDNETWSMIYSGVSSAVQSMGTSLGSVAAFGPAAGPIVAGLIMASEAAASQYRQSVQKGASPTEATLSSIAAGVAEYVFERISMENLFTIKDASPVNLSSARTIVKSLGRQFFNQAGHGAIEVSEELMTTLANLITDGMFDGSYLNEIESYKRLGVSHDVAVKLAGRSLSQQIAESAIGGFIGGFAGGGLAMVGSNIASIEQYAQVKKLVTENAEKIAADETAREDLIDFAQQAIAMTGEKTAERLNALVSKVREDPSVANVKKLMSAVDRIIKASELAAAKQSVKGVEALSEEQQEIFDQMIAKAEKSGLSHDEALQVAKKEYRQLVKENLKQVKDSSLPYSALAAEHARISRRAEKYVANGQGVDRIAQTEQEVSPTAAHIEQTENGPVFMLTLQDGSSVPASEISFASAEKAMAVEAIEGTGMDNESAFALYSTLDASTSPTVGRHIANAFRAGTVSLPQAEARGHAHVLTDEQFRLAYQAGQRQADETVKNAPQPQNAGEGGSFYDGTGLNLLEGEFRGHIKAQAVVLHRLSELMGLNLEVYQSKNGVFVDRRGVKHEAQGVFVREGDIIMVDLKAGNNYNGLMINTLAHELVHRIRAWSPAKFKKLADYLMESFGAHGVNVTRLINRQMLKDKTLDYDAAYEEVVADAMESMLHDGNVIAHVEQIRRQDASLGKKLIGTAKELFDKMLNAFRGEEFDAGPETDAGKVAAKMIDRVAELQHLFAEGLADAADQAVLAARRTDTVPKSKKPADDVAGVKNSLRQFEDGTRFVDVKTDQHLFDGLSLAEKTTLARNIIKQRFSGRVIGGENPVFVNGESAKEYSHPARNISDDIRDAKMRSATELDNLIAAGGNLRTEPDGKDGHTHPGVKNFSYLDVIFKVGNDYYSGIVNIENNNRGKRLKDITKIKNITEDIISSYGNNPKSEFLRDVSISSIPNSSAKSNPSDEKNSDGNAAEGEIFDNAQPMKHMLRSGFSAGNVENILRETRFGRQLADWLLHGGASGGTYNGKFFTLGDTPEALTKHGAPKAPLIMYDDCLVKITGGKHDAALEEIAKIPQELSDPILLFKGSVPNSFVAVTEIQTKQGHEAIVAVHVNKRHGRNVINKIASLHSRTTDYGKNYIVEYVNNQIRAGNLVDASTKKAPTWFTTRGLQLPKVVQTIIDANNSISNPVEKINPSEEKNSKRDKSNRAILEQALRSTANEQERTQINQYLATMHQTERMEEQVDQINRAIAAMDKTSQADKIRELRERARNLNEKIGKNDRLIEKLEQTEAMSRLISRLSDRTLTKENTPAEARVKNSIRSTADGIKYVKLDGNIFLRPDGTEMTKREAYNALVGRKITLEDGDVVTFIKNLPGGRSVYNELFNKRPGYEPGIDIVAVSDKINRNIVETVKASQMVTPNEAQRHPHVGVVDFDLREVYLADDNSVYRLELNIANLTDGEKIAYVKRYIERASAEVNEKIRKAETARQSPLNRPSYRDTAHRVNDVGRPFGNALKSGISINSISNPVEKINPSEEKNSKRDRSNRVILEQALRSTANEQERVQINQYLATMHQTERMEEQVDQINRAIAAMDKTLQADKIRELRERARNLNEKIGKNDRLIAKLEQTETMSRLISRLSDRTLTKENTPADAEVKNMKRNIVPDIVDLSKDNRLAKMIGGRYGSARYNIIRDYILDELKDQPIRMSDGKMAIVDRSDAQHIAHKSDEKKTSEIARIKRIVESAKLVAEESSAKERKFNRFWYYEAFVKYRGETIPVYVNIGQARNDSSYHIYDITQKLRDTAHRVYDVGRPVGNALVSSISNKSISNPVEKINPSAEKNYRRQRSNRDILTEALKTVANESERMQIDQYLSLMYQTDRLQGQVDELNARRKELDRKADKAEYDRINERLDKLNEQIGKNDRLIEKLEQTETMSRLISHLSDRTLTKENTPADARVKNSLRGYANNGRGMYEGNFPKGTPKFAKAEVILRYIQDVWSKKPIRLVVNDGEKERTIYAKFDPTYDEGGKRSDASKLMGGNRHGSSAEQRVTLDLADDYYQILSDARYNYTKTETGKESVTHQGVLQWHYFINDIYFAEHGTDEYLPYRVSVNVKEKADGNFVYSFSAEKQNGVSPQQTLHAAVSGKDAAKRNSVSVDSISNPAEKINPSEEKNSKRDKSNRAILEQALRSTANEQERVQINQYLATMHQTERMEEQVDQINRAIAAMDKTSQADKIRELRERARNLNEKIGKNDRLIEKLEQTETMSRLISRLSDRTPTKENTPANAEVKYMARKANFSSAIDSWDGKTIGFSFVVGKTSRALLDANIPNKQIRWDASKIKNLLGKHNGMTVAVIKEIPELLENPIIVIDSKTDVNSKIIMGDLRDENKKTVTVVFKLTPSSKKGNVLDLIKISSAEGRSHINSLFYYEDGTPIAVRYFDKKRIHDWLYVNRVQFPLRNLGQDSIDSISNPTEKINPSEEKNSKRDKSNRAILEQALQSTANEQERVQINQYLATMHQTERMEEQVDQINRAIAAMDKTLQADKIRELRERARNLNEKIGKNDRLIAKLGSQQAIGRVLERDRKAEEKRYAKQLAEYKDSVKRKEQIGRIKAVVAELHKLLFRPTKEAHIPENLRAPIAKALSMLNLDDTAGNNFSMQQWLEGVQAKYAEIQESADPVVRDMYYAEIAAKMQSALVVIGDTSLHDMTRRQVDAVYEVVSMLRHRVRDANRLSDRSRNSTVIEHKDHIKADLKKAGRGIAGKNVFGKFAGKALFDELKPVNFFRMINSPTMQYLFQNILDAQYTWAQTVAAATEFKAQLDEKYGAKDWDLKHLYEFTDADGKDFTLTIQQIMSLYGYGKRDAGRRHLFEKGFCFNERDIANGKKITYNTKEAYRLTPEILAQISEVLSPAQAAYQDEMQQYLHDVMGALGNEVSVVLFGVKLFNDPNYLPLSVRQDGKTTMQVTVAPRIVTPGYAKPLDPKADGAVVVNDFDDVWSRHVAGMAQYHAFALPIDDFTRVFDSRMGADGKTRIESNDSVRAALEENWGEAATDYITKLIRDINGGIHNGQRTWGEKALSTHKKVSTMASLSVIVQQMTSLPRAWALINPKYFLDIKKLKDEDLFHVHGENWDECKKYAPIAIIKEMGRYDTGVSAGTVDYIKGAAKGFNLKKLDDILGKAPGLMDELAWSLIWNAAKAEIADTTNLRGEELLQEAGRRFTEIIERTQVYDSVLTRSQIMRSSNFLAQTATSFMSEATVTVNMLIDALMDAKRNGKAGVGRLIRTSASIITSIVMNVLAKSFVYAMRDDDEDKTYWEKYVKAVVGGAKDDLNLLNLFPFARDIWSIVQGYDVGRSDMTLFADAWDDMQKIFTDELTLDEVLNVIGSVCNLIGIPARNAIRDVRAFVNTVIGAFSGRKTTGAGLLNAAKEGWSGKDTSNEDQLYAAYMSGDSVAIQQTRSLYKTESGADSALISALRKNDKRVQQAGQYRFEGNMLKQGKLINEIVAEGHFTQAQVMKAVLGEAEVCKEKQEPEKEPYDGTYEEVKDTTDPMSYTNADLKYAMDRGDQTGDIIESIVADKMSDGRTRSQALGDVRNTVMNTYKGKYLEAYASGDKAEMERIRQIMIDTELWKGSSAVKNVLSNWIKNEEENK